MSRLRPIRARLARLARPADSESGFSLVLAILVLAAASLVTFAAIDGVTGDVQLVRNSLDQNRALDAAQAGLAAFRQQLAVSGASFWQSCPGVNGTTGVTGITGRTAVPNSTDASSTEYYSYFELPATTAPSGDNKCDPANPAGTIQEGNSIASNSIRVEVRGTSNNVSRTIVAQLSPLSFLNYVWFTNYEDADPRYANETLTGDTQFPPVGPPESTVGGLNCAVYLWAVRSQNCTILTHGAYQFNGPVHANDDMLVCGEGSNTIFGRTSADTIETPNVLSEFTPSYATGGGGCNDPQSHLNMTGTPNQNVTTVQPPGSAAQLLAAADGANGANVNNCFAGYGCEFNGPATIVLDGPSAAGQGCPGGTSTNAMTVTNASYTSGHLFCYPSNGVVYVNATGSCTYSYTPYTNENQLYGGTTLDSGGNADTGCGDAVVMGNTSPASPYQPSVPSCTGSQVAGGSVVTAPGSTQAVTVCAYTQSLTIGAANDVIIASSLTTTTTSSGCAAGWATNTQSQTAPEASCPTGSATLGLVANDEVRMFHPVTGTRPTGTPPATVGYEIHSCPSTSSGGDVNTTGSLVNPVVDAAILALTGSFTVDNLDCGSGGSAPYFGTYSGQLGQLTLNGATAQNFFGQPGESNGGTGYANNYWYDSRLASDVPPYFPYPTNDSWQVVHEVECDTTC